jgi:transcriptional regulator with XRE-family HTH domain
MLPDGKFCERLDDLLKTRGIKPEDLAQMSGLTPTSVSRYRSGAREPTAAGLLALAVALEVTMEWLLTGDRRTIYGPLADATSEGMLKAAREATMESRSVLNEAELPQSGSYREVTALREENQRLRDIIGGVRALLASEPVAAGPGRPVSYRDAMKSKR